MARRLVAPLVSACLIAGVLPVSAAQAAGGRGSWTIGEGVRLAYVSFSSTTKDGRLRPHLLVVGRAIGSPRTLLLSLTACRSGAAACRAAGSRRVRFVRRPRTLFGWTATLKGAASITRLRYRLAGAGAKAGTMTFSLPRAAWTVPGFQAGLAVRESPTVLVDAVSFRVDPVAGGGATATAKATVRTPTAFDLVSGMGACGDFVGCPLPGAERTTGMVAGVPNALSITSTLPAPPAGTSNLRFRGDGGVLPAPFLSFLLPWPT